MKVDLCDLARAAGKTDRSFAEWLRSAEVQDHIGGSGRSSAEVEAAFLEGRRSRWTLVWTTAPEAYDWFGTATVEAAVAWRGKLLRQVAIDPQFFEGQTARYGSGLHGTWSEDPRVAEARVQRQIEQDRIRREQEAQRREAGLLWIASVEDRCLEGTDENYDLWHAHGLRSEDVRAERERRSARASADCKRALWARCAALIPEGASIVDPGAPSTVGMYGRNPGRDPYAWRSVRIVPGWPADDPDKANVVDEGNEVVASLVVVAEWISEGRVRIATPEDHIPPVAVMQRIGHREFGRIRRFEIDGVVGWVGCPVFGGPIALDERGHLVRSKKIRERAVAGYYKPDRGDSQRVRTLEEALADAKKGAR